jgi:hypothetical protein
MLARKWWRHGLESTQQRLELMNITKNEETNPAIVRSLAFDGCALVGR